MWCFPGLGRKHFSLFGFCFILEILINTTSSEPILSEDVKVIGSEKESYGLSRALFWVSPVVNFMTFFVSISFILMPLAFGWMFWLYPPKKYYYNVPPPPTYVGYSVMNITM